MVASSGLGCEGFLVFFGGVDDFDDGLFKDNVAHNHIDGVGDGDRSVFLDGLDNDLFGDEFIGVGVVLAAADHQGMAGGAELGVRRVDLEAGGAALEDAEIASSSPSTPSNIQDARGFFASSVIRK